jgi:SagB-type dehydrogenase family enzyme
MGKQFEADMERGRRSLKANWHRLEAGASDQSRGVPCPPLQKPPAKGAALVPLIPPEQLSVGRMALADAMASRKSRRRYSADPLTLEELSFLLWAIQGVRRHTPTASFRTVPSGGARHSIETYVHTARVTGLAAALHRYLPLDHALTLVDDRQSLAEEIDGGLMGQRWDAAATFLWTTIPYRMEWRYTVVAHKIIALDAGHVCQNLYLACESIGCGTCGIGAYDQEKLDRALGVDGRDEFAVYAAPVGRVRE